MNDQSPTQVAVQAIDQATQRSLDALRDGTEALRTRARHAGERTVDYIQDEPVKSVLFAAAAGAATALLLGMAARARR